jgi:hypothetical protein
VVIRKLSSFKINIYFRRERGREREREGERGREREREEERGREREREGERN